MVFRKDKDKSAAQKDRSLFLQSKNFPVEAVLASAQHIDFDLEIDLPIDTQPEASTTNVSAVEPENTTSIPELYQEELVIESPTQETPETAPIMQDSAIDVLAEVPEPQELLAVSTETAQENAPIEVLEAPQEAVIEKPIAEEPITEEIQALNIEQHASTEKTVEANTPPTLRLVSPTPETDSAIDSPNPLPASPKKVIALTESASGFSPIRVAPKPHQEQKNPSRIVTLVSNIPKQKVQETFVAAQEPTATKVSASGVSLEKEVLRRRPHVKESDASADEVAILQLIEEKPPLQPEPTVFPEDKKVEFQKTASRLETLLELQSSLSESPGVIPTEPLILPEPEELPNFEFDFIWPEEAFEPESPELSLPPEVSLPKEALLHISEKASSAYEPLSLSQERAPTIEHPPLPPSREREEVLEDPITPEPLRMSQTAEEMPFELSSSQKVQVAPLSFEPVIVAGTSQEAIVWNHNDETSINVSTVIEASRLASLENTAVIDTFATPIEKSLEIEASHQVSPADIETNIGIPRLQAAVPEEIEILASTHLGEEFELLLVHHEGIYALMIDNGENALMLKSFPYNPLDVEDKFILAQEAVLDHKTLFIIQLGDWQGILSLEEDAIRLQAEL